MNGDRMVVWGIAGSLRADSANRKLLAAARRHAPEDVELRITDLLADVPLYNGDLVARPPAAVVAIREEVAAADAILIATPEHNGGVPGVLKNALDWLSLPLGASVLQGKPVALMGASPGRLGTGRAQIELRTTFIFTQSLVVPTPELLLSQAYEHFDADGELTDPVAIDRIGSLYDGLRRLVGLDRLVLSVVE